jgi:hypothetical protein
MNLIDNLNAIENCKNDIKNALINKGVDMTGVAFSGYAGKIDELQLSSGDEPSTPTPSAEYIYSNGFITGGQRKDIANLESYQINLDSDNTCEFRLTCAKEYIIYTGEDYDIVFTVEVPNTYEIIKCVWLDESSNDKEMTQDLKANPRYTEIERNGIIYNSFIRVVDGGDMMNESGVNQADVKYIITIKKI